MLKKYWDEVNNRAVAKGDSKIVTEMLRIFCFATLLANGKVTFDDDLYSAEAWFDKLGTCEYCPFKDKCLATMLEQ